MRLSGRPRKGENTVLPVLGGIQRHLSGVNIISDTVFKTSNAKVSTRRLLWSGPSQSPGPFFSPSPSLSINIFSCNDCVKRLAWKPFFVRVITDSPPWPVSSQCGTNRKEWLFVLRREEMRWEKQHCCFKRQRDPSEGVGACGIIVFERLVLC